MAKTSLEADFWLQQLLNGAAAFIGLSVFFVTLNFYCDVLRRRQRDKHPRPDRTALDTYRDILIVGALIVFLPVCACAIVYAKAYKAYFTSQTEAEEIMQYTTVFKMSYTISLMYPVACVLPKLSICCFYLQFCAIIKGRLYNQVCIMIVFLIANAIAWFVPSAVVCYPVSQYWDIESTRDHCIDFTTFGTWISLPHIVSDLVMLVMPIPLLWGVQWSMAKRLSTIFMVLTGSIGIVAACLRLAMYIYVTYVERPNKAAQSTRSIAADVMVSYIKPGMYLIAACLPSLRPVYSQLYQVVSSRIPRISTFGKRCVNPNGDVNGSREASHREGIPDSMKLVDMKLTDIGDMQSLAHTSDRLGVGGAETA